MPDDTGTLKTETISMRLDTYPEPAPSCSGIEDGGRNVTVGEAGTALPALFVKSPPNPYFSEADWQRFAVTLSATTGAFEPTTLRAYASDLKRFAVYCAVTRQTGLPADATTLAGFIKSEQLRTRPPERAGETERPIRFQTIERALTSIRFLHQHARATDQTGDILVRNALKEAAKTLGKGQTQQQALRLTQNEHEQAVILLSELLAATDDTIQGLRDRILLSVGFDLGIRGQELLDIQMEDCEIHAGGGTISLQKTKTRLKGEAPIKPISELSAHLLVEWFNAVGNVTGPLIRRVHRLGNISDKGLTLRALNYALKRLGKQAGYSDEMVASLSSHSFRIGHAQELYLVGESIGRIMQAQDWQSPQTVLRYLRKLQANTTASADMLRKSRSAAPLLVVSGTDDPS